MALRELHWVRSSWTLGPISYLPMTWITSGYQRTFLGGYAPLLVSIRILFNILFLDLSSFVLVFVFLLFWFEWV